MEPPKMQKVTHRGTEQWEVQYAGMTRYFTHDWKAKMALRILPQALQVKDFDSRANVIDGLTQQNALMEVLLRQLYTRFWLPPDP